MTWLNDLAENIQEELDTLGYRVATSEIKKFIMDIKRDNNTNIFASTKKLARMYLKSEVKKNENKIQL